MSKLRNLASTFFLQLQSEYCAALEDADGSGRFCTDEWTRPTSPCSNNHTQSLSGGGITRVLKNGAVFEQGGVNFSEVAGTLPESMSKKLIGEERTSQFFATGVSLVIHPRSPQIPTVHANYRYLEVESLAWFGGGTDLTPYILYEEDARHFHQVLKQYCDSYDHTLYPEFKQACDKYFYLPHRNEARGIGGIFFDYLGKSEPESLERHFELCQALGPAFIESYLPLVEKRKHTAWSEEQKHFQHLRRGRYVEFNLIHDRGTLFGLQTGGRIESILMSLPPAVIWEYDADYTEGFVDTALLEVLRCPREWV